MSSMAQSALISDREYDGVTGEITYSDQHPRDPRSTHHGNHAWSPWISARASGRGQVSLMHGTLCRPHTTMTSPELESGFGWTMAAHWLLLSRHFSGEFERDESRAQINSWEPR